MVRERRESTASLGVTLGESGSWYFSVQLVQDAACGCHLCDCLDCVCPHQVRLLEKERNFYVNKLHRIEEVV